MKKSELPEWARKYDRPGLAFRKVGDSFQVLEVSSKRVEGKDYPVLSQNYIGTITEKDGLVPARKKKPCIPEMIECCLSHFVIENHARDIKRSFFNSAGPIAESMMRAAVLGWVFGCVPQERMIGLSALSIGFEEGMKKTLSLPSDRLEKAVASVQRIVSGDIVDAGDLAFLRARLATETVPKSDPRFPGYPDDIKELLAKYGGNYR